MWGRGQGKGIFLGRDVISPRLFEASPNPVLSVCHRQRERTEERKKDLKKKKEEASLLHALKN